MRQGEREREGKREREKERKRERETEKREQISYASTFIKTWLPLKTLASLALWGQK